MRSALVVFILLFPLLAGCTTDPKENLVDVKTETEPKMESESWTQKLYLLFPDPCPEDMIGTTTYDKPANAGERYCGNDINSNVVINPDICAIFNIHDLNYNLVAGNWVSAHIVMENNAKVVNIRMEWVDDQGYIAGSTATHVSINDNVGISIKSPVWRNSTTGLQFIIKTEGAQCGKINVGESVHGPSYFWTDPNPWRGGNADWNWTKPLYLNFPNPCPNSLAGNTTYKDPSSSPYRSCGDLMSALNEPPCAVFKIHDVKYHILSGTHLLSRVVMYNGPGNVQIRVVWADDEGILAEETKEYTPFIQGGYIEVITKAMRNSTSGLKLEIHAETGLSCGEISVGDSSYGLSYLLAQID